MKAKKYIQNLKQQAADATAARDQAVADMQAVQQQINEKKSTGVEPQQNVGRKAAGDEAGDAARDEAVPKPEYAKLQVT